MIAVFGMIGITTLIRRWELCEHSFLALVGMQATGSDWLLGVPCCLIFQKVGGNGNDSLL